MIKLYKIALVLCVIGLLLVSLDSALGEDPASNVPDATGIVKSTYDPRMSQNGTNISNDTVNGTNDTDANVSTNLTDTETPIETTVENTVTKPIETTVGSTTPESTPKETPGFGLIVAMVTIGAIYMFRRK